MHPFPATDVCLRTRRRHCRALECAGGACRRARGCTIARLWLASEIAKRRSSAVRSSPLHGWSRRGVFRRCSPLQWRETNGGFSARGRQVAGISQKALQRVTAFSPAGERDAPAAFAASEESGAGRSASGVPETAEGVVTPCCCNSGMTCCRARHIS